MANDSAMDASMDVLDQLLNQAVALNKQLAPLYPDIFANESAQSVQKKEEVDESRFFAPIAEEPAGEEQDSHALGSDDDSGPALNEDELQTYALRHKFCGLESIPAWDTTLSAQPTPEKRSAGPSSSLEDEELFLHVVSRFANGVKDEAGYGMAQMEKRGGNHAMLRFLPVYTALDMGASREEINRLIKYALESSNQSDQDAKLVELAGGMLQSVMQIIEDAEALQEAGYRNKQEALRVAADKAQQRADRLRQRANL